MHYLFKATRRYTFFLFCLFISLSAQAGFVNFEGLPDGTLLTNEIQGISFNDATVLTAGVSLNQIDFPPHSGVNVIAGLNGSLEIIFGDMMSAVSAYFSYTDPLTLTLADVNNVALFSGQLSANNAVESNVFFSFKASGIHSLLITSSSPFTLDDLAYVSEPATYLLLAIGVMGIGLAMVARTRFKSR